MSTVYADPAVLWQRALAKVTVTPEGCWEFTGCVNSQGYSCVAAGRKGKTILGHRLAVLVRDGSLSDLPVDHLCFNRRCICPDHLEVVTTAENNRRMREAHGYRLGGQCGSGHTLTEQNTRRHPRGQLVCRECEQQRRKAAAVRDALAAGQVPAEWVRAWAAEQGIAVAARGRLPRGLRDQYLAAHQPRAA